MRSGEKTKRFTNVRKDNNHQTDCAYQLKQRPWRLAPQQHNRVIMFVLANSTSRLPE
jgi:hypothetical protein